ncbi:MAG: hypothetical protein HUJ25_14240 [Crocinitomicaceae bacterium]|nr:hypothetical protein [Crocinitomicaceae bacterium]
MRSLSAFILFPLVVLPFITDRPDSSPQIKSIYTICYKASMKDSNVVKGEREWYNSYRYDTQYLFDKKGNTLQIIDYDDNGQIESKTNFSYSTEMNVTRMELYKYVVNKEVLDRTVKYYYDRYNFCYRDTSFNSKGKPTIYTKSAKDYNQNIEARKVFRINNEPIYSEIIYYYDDSTIQKTEQFNSNNQLEHTVNYFKDSLGRNAGYYVISGEDTSQYIQTSYNEEGYEIREITWSSQSEGQVTDYRFEYKFNVYGDWIQKLIYLGDELQYAVERYIEYYEEE